MCHFNTVVRLARGSALSAGKELTPAACGHDNAHTHTHTRTYTHTHTLHVCLARHTERAQSVDTRSRAHVRSVHCVVCTGAFLGLALCVSLYLIDWCEQRELGCAAA